MPKSAKISITAHSFGQNPDSFHHTTSVNLSKYIKIDQMFGETKVIGGKGGKLK